MFRRRRWFQGRPITGEDVADIAWFTPEGTRMSRGDWDVSFARSLQVFLNGEGIASPDPRGQPVVDDTFLLLFNAYDERLAFTLPGEDWAAGLGGRARHDRAAAARRRRGRDAWTRREHPHPSRAAASSC